MKIFSICWVFIVLVGGTELALAQSVAKVDTTVKKMVSAGFKQFISNFQLRKSFQSVKDREDDAFVNLVFPNEGKSSQNYAFALGYNIESGLSAFKPFIEWQRNNIAEKQQNVFLSGLSFQTYLRKIKPNMVAFPMLVSAVNYKHDNIKSTEGAQANLYFSLIFIDRPDAFYPLPGAINENRVMNFVYDIYLGVEFESRSQVLVPTHKGEVLRGFGKIKGSFYPAPALLDERVELVPEFVFRRALSNTSTAEKDTNSFLKLTANFVLAKKAKSGFADVKIGYDYVKGSDPTLGFDNQDISTITLKLKI